MRKLIFSALLGGALSFGLSAQTPSPTILFGQDTALTGETVCLPVTVSGMSTAAAMQWTMAWDTTQLQFAGVQEDRADLSPANFAYLPVSKKCTFSWNTTAINQQLGVLDSSGIFNICFKVLAPLGSTCVVRILEESEGAVTPPGIYYAQGPGIPALDLYTPDIVTPGTIYVGTPTGVSDLGLPALRLFPNPTSGPLTLTNLPTANWHYQLSDAAGRLVLAGSLTGNSLDLSGQQPGLYLLSLRSETAQLRPVPVVVAH